jgi:hypothetical protein
LEALLRRFGFGQPAAVMLALLLLIAIAAPLIVLLSKSSVSRGGFGKTGMKFGGGALG